MGLIEAIGGTIKGVAADQWKEYFYCDALPDDVLVTKGRKRTQGAFGTKNNSNDNLITNGSVIAVNEGQCMIIVDQGQVVEFSAKAGEFLYDTSTEPSLLYGDLGENIKNTFSQIGRRFTFGGQTGKDQRIYFFNTKEIKNNKYGTAQKIPFRAVDKEIGLNLTTQISCNGMYSYQIFDPILFYTNVCANVADEYNRSELDPMLKAEVITALTPALGQISSLGIRYDEVNIHQDELLKAMNDELNEKWGQIRGMRIVSFNISPLNIPEKDLQMIQDLQRTKSLTDAGMAAATLVSAQADAMRAAAANEQAGPMMAFAGMNMASMTGGMDANSLFALHQQNQQAQQAAQMQQQAQPTPAPAAPMATPAADSWTCSCGATNTGNFCMQCGGKKPAPAPATEGWSCSCGTVNQGNFCMNCGTKRPADAPLYRCDKCGWQPADPKNPPKFCPECGDIFDENDAQ